MANWFQKKAVPPSPPLDIERCLNRLSVLDELSKRAIDKFFILVQESKIELDEEVEIKRLYESRDGLRGYTKKENAIFALVEIAFASQDQRYSDNDSYIRCPIGEWITESAWFWWCGLTSSLNDPEKLNRLIEIIDNSNTEQAVAHAEDVDYLRNHFLYVINGSYQQIRKPSFLGGAPSREERRIEKLERSVNDWAVRYHRERTRVDKL
jgi:hypothetical protein